MKEIFVEWIEEFFLRSRRGSFVFKYSKWSKKLKNWLKGLHGFWNFEKTIFFIIFPSTYIVSRILSRSFKSIEVNSRRERLLKSPPIRIPARKKFLREILYKNIAIIAIQHSKMYFFDSFSDFSHTVEWNSLESVWQISLYILA